ncbi:M23 family metallopeptidase [Naasia lichenicola]|nr:M23 family metallopeptidase [Naasia lichenicola]
MTTTVPAAAVDIRTIASPSVNEITHANGDSQGLVVTDGAVAAFQRDTFSATEPGSIVNWPFPQYVALSDDFGPRPAPCSGCSTYHRGLDMVPGAGTPIQAVALGTVRETGSSDSGFGVYAVIDHVVDGQRISSLYAHMQFGSLQVSEGDTVTAGQMLGRVGDTGLSTGPHLHFELWDEGVTPIDPYRWLNEKAPR